MPEPNTTTIISDPIYEQAQPAEVCPVSVNFIDRLKHSSVSPNDFNVNTAPLFDGFINWGQTIVIKAPSESGSTWLALEIIQAVLKKTLLFSYYPYQPSADNKNGVSILITAGVSETVLIQRLRLIGISELSENFVLISKEYQKKHNIANNIYDLDKNDWMDNLTQKSDDREKGHLLFVFDSLDSLVNFDKDTLRKNIEALHYNLDVTQVWIDKGTKKGFEIPSENIDLQLELKPIKDRSNVSMEVNVIKANDLPKDKTHPFIIELQENPEGEPKMRFCLKTPEVEKAHIAVAMLIEGLSQSEIAERLKVSQSMVSKWRSDAIESKLIVTKGHNNIATPAGEKLIKGIKVNI
jgi:hypothetical protein